MTTSIEPTLSVKNGELDASSVRYLHVSKLKSILEKFARSLTGSNISVNVEEVVSPNKPPAWSNDSSLTITYEPYTPLMSVKSLIRIKGLLIHEASHLLYTPKSLTALAKWVHQQGHSTVFNMLEDNRIENLIVAKLSGVAPWLTYVVTKELLSDEQYLPDVHMLIHGRKYLPQELRAQAKAAWTKLPPAETAMLEELIDEYITLNLSNTKINDRVKYIIMSVSNLLRKTNEQQRIPPMPNLHMSSDCIPDSKDSIDQPTTKQQERLLDKVKEQVAADDADDAVDDGQGSSANQESTDSYDAGPEASNAEVPKTLSSVIENTLESALDELIEESVATIKTIKGSDEIELSKSSAHINAIHTYSSREVPSSISDTYQQFAKEMMNLKALFDPAWNVRQPEGRINVRRFMLEDDFDEAFDLWDSHLSDATDIECVILVDVSGSMSRMLDETYASAWAIKRALDKVQASTTVIQYGDDSHILYPANNVAGIKMRTARFHSGSSTNPYNGLKYARSVFANSSRALTMLIVITDGEWNNSIACNGLIMQMRQAGVMTGLAYLVDPRFSEMVSARGIDAHFCEIAQHINDPKDLVKFARQLTALSQKRILGN